MLPPALMHQHSFDWHCGTSSLRDSTVRETSIAKQFIIQKTKRIFKDRNVCEIEIMLTFCFNFKYDATNNYKEEEDFHRDSSFDDDVRSSKATN